MRKTRLSRRKRDGEGAIGIGTLIVFIAMVLVAVIAAAVIIKTASELEQSAEKVGDESRREAGLSIKVIQFEGQADGAGAELVNLQLYITLFGGSESLDMRYLILHIFGTDNDGGGTGYTVDYIHPNAQNPPAGANNYAVTEITDPLDSYDPGGGQYVMDQQSTLRIDLTGIDGTISDGLSPLSDVTVQFYMSNGGAITTESASTPGSYLANGWYNLV